MRSRLEPMKKVARMLRAHEELTAELVPGQRRDFQRCRRGPEQQNPSGDQTILRFPHLRSAWKSPCITRSDGFRNRNQPTDSAEEAIFFRTNAFEKGQQSLQR